VGERADGEEVDAGLGVGAGVLQLQAAGGLEAGAAVAAAGSVGAALAAARRYAPDLPCEVEVDTLDQLDEVLALGAELVLLDNFTVADTAEAVRRRGSAPTGLESSGGLRLENARAYAETGVDYLAVGALTHSVMALDLGLDLR
jgi:nicotinate-nucleotide pyrophosphorylase (carboxylating)